MILDLLLGRHGYSLMPEEETDWCRLYLALGFIAGGFVVGLAGGFVVGLAGGFVVGLAGGFVVGLAVDLLSKVAR